MNEIFSIKGKLYSKDTNKLVFLFTLDKVNLNVLESYIYQRQIELIKEFRTLKEKYIF